MQSPLRYEYLRAETASAWRPQEALSVAGVVSLIERVNALPGGPATGAPLSFVMTTGDNTDNNSKLELEWFLTAMSGGRITPNSGDPRRYEGVQDSGLKLYWQPDSALRDADKQQGFPRLDGFLEAAIRTVHSPGLRLPWYSTVGNHDSLPGGCYAPGDPFWTDTATGGRKLETLPAAEAAKVWKAVKDGLDPEGADFKRLLTSHAKQSRRVTPDERRAPFTRAEYLRAHLDPAHTGPGPHGHGYTSAHLDGNRLYYTFRISDDVLGISLDTTDPGGHYTGSVGDAQLRWLERTLKENEKGEKAHVLVFSHHTSKTMNNTRPDPAHPHERRHNGAELVEVLAAHPGVVGWINERQERHHRARQLLGDLHRFAHRLPAAGPGHRAGGQPRRHAVAVHHLGRVGRPAPHGLHRPLADRTGGPLPRAVLQRPRGPYGPGGHGRGPQRRTAAQAELTAAGRRPR